MERDIKRLYHFALFITVLMLVTTMVFIGKMAAELEERFKQIESAEGDNNKTTEE